MRKNRTGRTPLSGKAGPRDRGRGFKPVADSRSLVASSLLQMVTITDGGEKRRCTRLEALVTRLAYCAAAGDAKALGALLRLVQDYPPPEAERQIIIKEAWDPPRRWD